MIGDQNLSVRLTNYKSLGPDGLRLGQIKPVNVIIGRNNSGKSSVLELIDFLCTGKIPAAGLRHRDTASGVFLERIVPEDVARRAFPENTSGGHIGGNHWHLVGQYVAGSKIEVRVLPNSEIGFAGIEMRANSPVLQNPEVMRAISAIAPQIKNPFRAYTVVRLASERDIRTEPLVSGSDISVQPNGDGATATIAKILNHRSFDSKLIEEKMLAVVNGIFGPDATFTDVVVQQDDNNIWEIYLEESEKGRIALSNSGSGLKTVILVTLLFDVLPSVTSKLLNQTIFLLEELENNLHPALQRKLFSYVRDTAVARGAVVFLTTHSSAVIDLFSKDDCAQIAHISTDNGVARGAIATTYVQHKGVLDDLDVRASDILQSNGIVWVEGPSDRVYVNRWIDLLSKSSIREGTHYQCLFYGGRLLAHLSALSPDEADRKAIAVLGVNRNAILMLDSDRSEENEGLNATKSRIISEVEDFGGFAWITAGREIENYISAAVLNRLDSRLARAAQKFEKFTDVLREQLGEAEASRIFKSKAVFSEQVAPVIALDDITADSELLEALAECLRRIRSWNSLPGSIA